jgi:hypothetical protein
MKKYLDVWGESGSIAGTLTHIIKDQRETNDMYVRDAQFTYQISGAEHTCSVNARFYLAGKYEPANVLVEVNVHFTQVSVDTHTNYGTRVMDTVSFTVSRETDTDVERIWMYTADEYDQNSHIWWKLTDEYEVIGSITGQIQRWTKQDAFHLPKWTE